MNGCAARHVRAIPSPKRSAHDRRPASGNGSKPSAHRQGPRTKIVADPIGIGVKAGKSSRTSCSQAVGRKEHSEVSGRAWCSHGRSSRFRGSYSMDEDIFRKLEERLGPLHARQRLGIETDREAQIFGQGLLFFHIGNWYPVRSVIRNALKLTGLYWRARRNTERILVKRSQSRRRRRPLTTPSCWTEARLQAVIAIGPIAVMKRACIM